MRGDSVKFEAILFDGSGVLFDDLYAVWRANADAYEALGLGSIGTLEQFRKSFRLPINEFHRHMRVPEKLFPLLKREWMRAYQKYADHVKLFPEVRSVLEKLTQERVKLAIASNIPKEFLREHLETFKIDRYFIVATSQEDCEEQKPSPQPLLITLKRLGVKPGCAAYVGDMAADIIAGKRAGVYTFALCRGRSYQPLWKLKRQKPDSMISDLNDLARFIYV